MLKTASATVHQVGMGSLANGLVITLTKNVALTSKGSLLIYALYMEVYGFPNSFLIFTLSGYPNWRGILLIYRHG